MPKAISLSASRISLSPWVEASLNAATLSWKASLALIWKATAEQICSGNIIYDEGMSEDLKGLLSQMLTVDPDERPTARDVLDHPWVQNTDDPNDGDEPDPNMVSFIESVISTLDSMCF